MMNPAAAGTRQDIRAGMDYRYQWAGMNGGPRTMSAYADGKLFKEKLGLGAFVFQDKIGVFSATSIALAAAYRIKFPDLALSFGLNGNYNIQGVDASQLTYQNTQDEAMLNLLATPKARVFNIAGGVMLYNDRFRIAISVNNLAASKYKYYASYSPYQKGQFTTVPHFCVSLGYNWNANQNFLWENNFMAVLVSGVPILIDYYLRLHIKHSFFVGAGIRASVALEAQLGWTFQNIGQISYAYDYNTNPLGGLNGGSHEIKLIFFYQKNRGKRRGKSVGEFLHQKYQYML